MNISEELQKNRQVFAAASGQNILPRTAAEPIHPPAPLRLPTAPTTAETSKKVAGIQQADDAAPGTALNTRAYSLQRPPVEAGDAPPGFPAALGAISYPDPSGNPAGRETGADSSGAVEALYRRMDREARLAPQLLTESGEEWE